MKITMYDLFGMVKDGKAPKKIRFDNTCWNRINGEKNVYYINDNGTDLFIYFFRKNLTFTLNDEVEIPDYEEEKEIPEKLEYEASDENGKFSINGFTFDFEQKIQIIETVNEIIEYLKSKGDE